MKHLIILSCVLCYVNQLFSQDASLIYQNTVYSTVTIETENGLGSGFFVAPNIIATNYHVMEGAINPKCYLYKSDTKYEIEGYVGIDKSVDLILLKVSTFNNPSIKFAAATVSIGQKVYVIGSPKGLPTTISDGIISGMRDFEGLKLIQMTAPISPGSSGGPVLNSNGELIGISVSQLKDGQNINFAIPKSYLEILLTFKTETPIAFSTLKKDRVLHDFTEMIDSFGVEILHIGGIGSHQVQIQAFYLSEHGYLDNPKSRIKYFFNNAGDILWVSPSVGYDIDLAIRNLDGDDSSPIESDDLGSYPLYILDQMQNKFFIKMKKKSFEKYLQDKIESEK